MSKKTVYVDYNMSPVAKRMKGRFNSVESFLSGMMLMSNRKCISDAIDQLQGAQSDLDNIIFDMSEQIERLKQELEESKK